MDNFGLPERTIVMITEYFKSIPQIETVKIFGSRARGNYKPYSDIDFVLYGKELTSKLVNRISTELDELPTPYKFDVLLQDDITNPKLLDNINNTAQTFYQNQTI